jgi:hypothetical protein
VSFPRNLQAGAQGGRWYVQDGALAEQRGSRNTCVELNFILGIDSRDVREAWLEFYKTECTCVGG